MRLSESIDRLDSSRGSYVYLIRGEETILVDTGLPFKRKQIIRELESMGALSEIKHIFITHHDIDHIANAYALQRLTGAKVWASKEDIPYILGEIDRSSFKKYLKYIFRLKVPETIEPYPEDGTVCGVEIIPAPGHTPGHVCLLYQGSLFVGDLLEMKDGKLRPYPSAWNWDNALMAVSVEKISAMSGIKRICPAHGELSEGNYQA